MTQERELTDFEMEGLAYAQAGEFLEWAWLHFSYEEFEYHVDTEKAFERYIHMHGYALPWYIWEAVLDIHSTQAAADKDMKEAS